MKKKMIKLGLISFASVLAFSSCAQLSSYANPQVETSVTFDEDFSDLLPKFSTLPIDGELVDLTEDFDFSEEEGATAEELLDVARSVAGKAFIDMYYDEFKDVLDEFAKYNVMDADEFKELFRAVYPLTVNPEEADPYDLLKKIATTVNVEKLFYTARELKKDPQSMRVIRRFAIKSEQGFEVNPDLPDLNEYYNGEDPVAKSYYDQYETYWQDFNILGAGLEAFQLIESLFDSENVRVALRFVNHIIKSFYKKLNQFEFGFILANLGMVTDGQFAEICMKYVENNPFKIITDISRVLKELNLTDNSWELTVKGIGEFAKVSQMTDYADTYATVVSEKHMNILDNQIRDLVESVDPLGFKTLINFFGRVFSGLTEEVVDKINRDARKDPASVDLTPVMDIYNREYGLLTAEEKTALNLQADIFGIDIENFNTDISDISDRSPFGPIGDIITINFVEPFQKYLGNIFAVEEPYDWGEGFEFRKLYTSGNKYILRQGDEITEEDTIEFLKSKEAFRVEGNYHYDGSQTSFEELVAERTNFNFVSTVDTSEVGYFSFVVKFDLRLRAYRNVYDEETDQYNSEAVYSTIEQYEARIFYHVIEPTIDFISYNYRNYLNRVSTAFADGNYVYQEGRYDVISLVQNVTYTPEKAKISSEVRDTRVYAPTLKRFVNLDDNDYAYDQYFDVASLDNTTLGRHYAYELRKVKYQGQPIATIPLVICYDVVEGLPFDIVDGFFDPGFGY